jgi:hypothetical protein
VEPAIVTSQYGTLNLYLIIFIKVMSWSGTLKMNLDTGYWDIVKLNK